jgi:antitoxin (DNA-binding transcriptional repressor) of toxin-antitoxin stability system
MTIHVTREEFEERTAELLDAARSRSETILVTDGDKTVFELKPLQSAPVYTDEMRQHDDAILASLRGTLLRYDRPFDSVGEEDWEVLK